MENRKQEKRMEIQEHAIHPTAQIISDFSKLVKTGNLNDLSMTLKNPLKGIPLLFIKRLLPKDSGMLELYPDH